MERAHNLSNGAPLLGGVEAEETSQRGSVLSLEGDFYQGNKDSLASRVTVCAVCLRGMEGCD